MKENDFSEAMERLFNLILAECGSEHPVLETIVDWFADDKEEEMSFKFNDDGMFYLLRDLMNWDFFWVTEEGRVDVDNANEPEMAKLLEPFVSSELALRVKKSF